MKKRSLLILLALLGGLALWSNWPAPVIAQQAADQEDHAGQSPGDTEADEHKGHEHAAREEADGADADGHADKQDDHAGHEHGDEAHADHGKADDHDDHAGHGDANAEHDDHGGQEEASAGEHDDHEGHGHEEEAAAGVSLSPEVMREFDIEVRTAGAGVIEQTVRLPGEVVYNADRIADVTPSVSGITRRVTVSVGDRVEAGQVLAVLSSRELAAARSDYLAAQARLALAEENLKRDKRLFEEKVGTERAVIESGQAFEDAKIALGQAETSLHALGLSEEQIDRTAAMDHGELSRYELVAPLSAIVTERDLTIGEVVEPTADGAPLVVADLSTVWVNLTVYQRDLAHVRAGQPVAIRFGHGIPDTDGKVAFVSPALEESTRTAFARIVLANPDRHWRPGLFVEGVIETGHDTATVVVPRSAVIGMDGRQVVFVQTEAGLEPRPVRLGRQTDERVEVVDGLRPGERYAANGVVTLKAQMNSAALEHAGHAH